MSRRKIKVKCNYCNKEFESILRWEGVPEKEYCSSECDFDDRYSEYDDQDTFEKFSKGSKDQWH